MTILTCACMIASVRGQVVQCGGRHAVTAPPPTGLEGVSCSGNTNTFNIHIASGCSRMAPHEHCHWLERRGERRRNAHSVANVSRLFGDRRANAKDRRLREFGGARGRLANARTATREEVEASGLRRSKVSARFEGAPGADKWMRGARNHGQSVSRTRPFQGRARRVVGE